MIDKEGPLHDKMLKPGQLFTVHNHVYQMVKEKNSSEQCEKCAARRIVRYRVGSVMKTSYYCDLDFPMCQDMYFKLIK